MHIECPSAIGSFSHQANSARSDNKKGARRVTWFEPPAAALADPARFMADAIALSDARRHEDHLELCIG